MSTAVNFLKNSFQPFSQMSLIKRVITPLLVLTLCVPSYASKMSNNEKEEDKKPIVYKSPTKLDEKTKDVRLILCIDGGGIRGILPAMILDWLEQEVTKEINHHHPKAPPFQIRIGECFDLFAGTSTGGLISLGLNVPQSGRPKYAAKTFVDLYEQKGKDIFPKKTMLASLLSSKFSPIPLEKILQGYFGDLSLKDLLKPTLITTYDIHGESLFVFNSQEAQASDVHNYKLKKVARATSAAPTFLPAVDVENLTTSPTTHTFIDGGVTANNPTLIAYLEAQKLYPRSKFHIISLGCGATSLFTLESKKQGGLLQWGPDIASVIMDSSSRMTHNLTGTMAALRGDQYIRVQFALDKKVAAMDNTSKENLVNLKGYAKREFSNSRSRVHQIKTVLLDFYKANHFYVHFSLIHHLKKQIEKQSQKLDLTGQFLTHRGMWEITHYLSKNPHGFTALNLSHNKLDQNILQLLGSFKDLKTIDLKNTHLTLSLLECLKNYHPPHLKGVNICKNPQLSKISPSELVTLINDYDVKADEEIYFTLGQYWHQRKDYEKAVGYYQKGESFQNQRALAEFLRTPVCILPQKLSKVFAIYKRFAEKGDKDAQFLLGCFYLQPNQEEKLFLIETKHLDAKGDQTLLKAAGWFKLAALQGHKRAAYKLGEFYEKNKLKADRQKGTKRDGSHQLKEALKYYLIAQKAGSQSASKHIARIQKELEVKERVIVKCCV